MTTSITSSTTAYAATGYQLVTAANQAQQAGSLNNGDESASRTAASQGQDTAAVSKMGKLLSKLQSLADSDPDEFKQTAQTISDNLAQSAADATDPMQEKAFTDMSARFAEAAESGSMDSLGELANGPPASGRGSDTVSISGQARELAAQSGSAGTGETAGDAADSGVAAQASGGQSAAKGSGGAKAGGGSGGSTSGSTSDSGDSEEDIDDQITELKDKIAKKEASLTEAKQQGKMDSMKADEAEKLTTELADLNNQLSQLQMEKLQAQSESSSSSSSGSSGGGAAMTTHQ